MTKSNGRGQVAVESLLPRSDGIAGLASPAIRAESTAPDLNVRREYPTTSSICSGFRECQEHVKSNRNIGFHYSPFDRYYDYTAIAV